MWEVTIAGTVVSAQDIKITKILNNLWTADFVIPNTDENRELLGTAIKAAVIKLNDVQRFSGQLTNPTVETDRILCHCLDTVQYKMDLKPFTGQYNGIAVNTIASDICAAADVTWGSNITYTRYLQFKQASCLYSGIVLVAHCGTDELGASTPLDWWTDETKFYIGQRGSVKGEVALVEIGQKTVDYSKIKDRVDYACWTTDGIERNGWAGQSGGTQKLFRKNRNFYATVWGASPQCRTPDQWAYRLYLKLNEPIVRIPVKIDIVEWDDKDLDVGDSVTVDSPNLGLSGSYRIMKAIITEDMVVADLVKAEHSLVDEFLPDLGSDEQADSALTNASVGSATTGAGVQSGSTGVSNQSTVADVNAAATSVSNLTTSVTVQAIGTGVSNQGTTAGINNAGTGASVGSVLTGASVGSITTGLSALAGFMDWELILNTTLMNLTFSHDSWDVAELGTASSVTDAIDLAIVQVQIYHVSGNKDMGFSVHGYGIADIFPRDCRKSYGSTEAMKATIVQNHPIRANCSGKAFTFRHISSGTGSLVCEVTVKIWQAKKHVHSLSDPGHTNPYNDAYHANPFTDPQHGHTSPGHTHTVTDPTHGHSEASSHTHTVSDPTHPHASPGHGHTITDPTHPHGVTDPGHTNPFNDARHLNMMSDRRKVMMEVI